MLMLKKNIIEDVLFNPGSDEDIIENIINDLVQHDAFALGLHGEEPDSVRYKFF